MNKTAIFLALCKQSGLPAPELEYRFHPTRKWRFDVAFVDYKVALEIEGAVWTGGRHTRGSGFVKDMEKYSNAAILGWRLLRCTPTKLCTTETIEMVKAALAYRPCAEWEAANRDMRGILLRIHSARVAMSEAGVIKGLEDIDRYFREPNCN